jgi:hypothetical protein
VVNGGLEAAAEIHWVATCCCVLDALGVDGTGEDGGCCCAVAGHLVSLLCDVLDEAGN